MIVNSGNLILNIKEDIFNKYEKLQQIGEGSYGKVFKVKNSDQEFRALKVITKKVESCANEIENMKKLDHPNIMSTYETAEDDQHFYIVCELCEGTELFVEIHRRIQRKEVFSEEEVRIIFKQILSAVAYAHQKNIMHRDIKPENILINTTDLHIKIIDWGLSKDMTDIQSIKQKIGTVDYAAPEVLTNQGYDNKCDVWSCGVILYILLSGESPFPGSTTGEIERMIIQSKINMKQKIWKSITQNAKLFLGKLLQPNPKNRITAIEALEDPWIQQQVLHNQPETDEMNYRLNKLAHFCCQSKLVQATIHLMIQQNLKQSKLKSLRHTFELLDTNGDGRLSYEELKKHANQSIDLQLLFDRVDTDSNGYIDFTEFLAAAVDVRSVASKEQLQAAFSILDQNGDGFLEIEEIKQIFGGKIQVTEEKGWDTLLNEMDSNKDGKISFDEYFEVIQKFIENTPQSQMPSQEVEPIIRKQVKLVQSPYNLRHKKQP